MSDLFLVEPDIEYQKSFENYAIAYGEIHDEYYFNKYKKALENFREYLDDLRGDSIEKYDLPQGEAATLTFWLMDHTEVVGVLRIRPRETGPAGNIGYDISPVRRNRGYGFQILKLALEKAAKMGMEEVVLTCNINNAASKKIIEMNNGKLLGTIFDEEENEYLFKYKIELAGMSQKEQLRSDLRRIAENGYRLSDGENVSRYADAMLQNIGDTDPELRDDLIYSTFNEWIYEKEYFSEEDLLHMLGILFDENHLFFRIGNDGDTSVFTRTFSILVVVLIMSRHRKRGFLNADMFLQAKNTIIRYYREEKDLRGYTDEYGWAHGAAHGADALDELAQCKESNEKICREILDSMQEVLYNGKYFLCNEDDERMARVVYRMVKGNSADDRTIGDWIGGLLRCCAWERNRKQYIARVNTKNFVRCLYFKLLHNQAAPDIGNMLLNAEGSLNRFLQIDRDI